MEIDKEKLLLSIKQALSENSEITKALDSGNKEQIINSLPTDTKAQLENILKDREGLKQLLNSKEAKDLVSKYLKGKWYGRSFWKDF